MLNVLFFFSFLQAYTVMQRRNREEIEIGNKFCVGNDYLTALRPGAPLTFIIIFFFLFEVFLQLVSVFSDKIFTTHRKLISYRNYLRKGAFIVLLFIKMLMCCWKFVLKLFYAILCDFEKNGLQKNSGEKKNTLVFEI